LRADKTVLVVLVATAILGTAGTASAHRLDECLQAARIAIEPDHIEIELSLTPGVEVAAAMLDDIDRDHDESLSATEQQAFVRRVVAALDLAHDGRSLDLVAGAVTFPPMDSLRRGEGAIQLLSSAGLTPQLHGRHQVSFSNRYRPDMSVYLANALVPRSDRIAVTAQRRTVEQRDLRIDYTLHPGRSTSAWILGGVVMALGGVLGGGRLTRGRRRAT
jgi:hypothetical protein